MQVPATPRTRKQQLVRSVRAHWLAHLQSGLPQIGYAVDELLQALVDETAASAEMAKRRKALQMFRQLGNSWTGALGKSFSEFTRNAEVSALESARSLPPATLSQFELVGDEVFENKIIASRISMAVSEAVAPALETLRMRMHALGAPGWPENDLFRPETVSLLLVECWVETGLAREDLQLCIEPLQRVSTDVLLSGYEACNRLLEEHGVSAKREFRVHMRGAFSASAGTGASDGRFGAAGITSQMLVKPTTRSGQAADTASGGQVRPTKPEVSGANFARVPRPARAVGSEPESPRPRAWEVPQLALARGRARSAITQLHQILVPLQGYVPPGHARPASVALAHALAAHRESTQIDHPIGVPLEAHNAATVARVATKARESSSKLKEQAETDSEKAIIEVVALMFQSILSEERIAPAVRVWFARLQVPVLRLALAEPEFFNNEDHAARKLIDRMGAVALGFDSATVSSGALESEVRRIVQVIEQFPETGRRVYELVYREFEKFLAKHLTEKVTTAKVISVAQQVEQKETLAIKYTIEFRTLLDEVEVDEEVRNFLFKVWAEVLALSAIRSGVTHEETMAFNRTAADIVWAASAKQDRSERAQVIQSLPPILQRVRAGLALLGLEGDAQDEQISSLTDTLAKAFRSRAAPVPLERIEAMVRRLANVEEFLGDAVLGDLPLDAENIEMLTGIDAAALQVLADNGVQAQEAMVAWAQQLSLGNWFTLEHKGSDAQVQYVWHSERKQLHLFVTSGGTSFLVQLNRLASFLQHKLLVASEEDGLITRATRHAADKLNADPGLLLG